MSPVLPFAFLTFLCASPWMPPDWTETKTTVLTFDHEMLEHSSKRVKVLGSPAVAKSAGCEGMVFDGVDDGVVADCNPLCGVNAFAIEVLIAPAAGGPEEQRFLHIEDETGRRTVLELRMVGTESWTLDTYLHEDDANRRTLIDRTKTHSANHWTWIALRCDGTTMQHYVNGVLEAEGPIALHPFSTGRVSVGMRLNQVSWYKGLIGEVRVHRALVPVAELQRR